MTRRSVDTANAGRTLALVGPDTPAVDAEVGIRVAR